MATMSGSSWARVLNCKSASMTKFQRHCETHLQRLFTAALLVLYGAQPYVLPVADPELTNMTRPFTGPSFIWIQGRTERSALTCEKKLTSKCCFHASTFSWGLVILPVGSKTAAFKIKLLMCP
jgi:hypothetical protein